MFQDETTIESFFLLSLLLWFYVAFLLLCGAE